MKTRLIAAALFLAASAASAAQISEYLSSVQPSDVPPLGWLAAGADGTLRVGDGSTAFSALTPISGSGVTDIVIVESPSSIAVQSSSGADDAIALANGTNAGAMSPGHYTKLEGIEAGAAADQTGAEIKAAYEAEADTNAYTDAEKSKLGGIEAGADVTDATNVNAAGAVMNSDTSTAGMGFVIDEDNMASASATKVPTQQSVKEYVDAAALGGGAYYATDADVGLIIGASGNVTTTATPDVTNTAEVNLNVTACTGLTVSKVTGTVGTGKIYKQITITNSCGGDLDVTWDVSGSGYKKAGNLDVNFTLATGTFKTVDIMTPNQGTDWYILTGEKDVSALPTGTVAGTSLLEVRTAAGAVIKSTVQSILDLLSGVYQPASAALTSWAAKAIPTGTVVGTTDTQTLSAKTLTAPNVENADTTITRTGAGAIAVEGVGVALNSTSLPHTASQLEVGAAADTTIARNAAGRITVEGKRISYLGNPTPHADATRVLSAGDDVLMLLWTNTGAKTYTIATGTAAAGDEWTGCNNGGTGDLTVVQGSGMTLIGNLVFNPGECYLIKFTTTTTANVIGGGAS